MLNAYGHGFLRPPRSGSRALAGRTPEGCFCASGFDGDEEVRLSLVESSFGFGNSNVFEANGLDDDCRLLVRVQVADSEGSF